MRVSECLLLCAVLAAAAAQMKEQDFWSEPNVGYGQPFLEIPVGSDSGTGRDLDRIQVLSAALKIRPRGDKRHRQTREAQVGEVQSWRRPRQHQFVTKADRLPPSVARLYPPFSGESQDRGYRKSQRRIIYYATLPEIVRPPTQWLDRFDAPRRNYPVASPSSYSASIYPSPADNEITRVQSNIIDVSGSRYSGHQSTPKFTIIDVDPPYNFYNSYNRQPSPYNNYQPYYPQYSPPNRFYNDVPYRDQYLSRPQEYRPDSVLEPVKLQSPSTENSSNVNSTESPANTTRFLPDSFPASIRSLAKFTT